MKGGMVAGPMILVPEEGLVDMSAPLGPAYP